MTNDFWSQLDTYIFRFLGITIGVGGCMGLIFNNPTEKLLHNIYGVSILVMFAAMAGYSLYSILMDLKGPHE